MMTVLRAAAIQTESRRAARTMCATTLVTMMHHPHGEAIAMTTMIVDIAQVAEIATATGTVIEIETVTEIGTETETETEIEVAGIRRKTIVIETEGTVTEIDREIDIMTVTVIAIVARPAVEIETVANEVKTDRGGTAKVALLQATGRRRMISMI